MLRREPVRRGDACSAVARPTLQPACEGCAALRSGAVIPARGLDGRDASPRDGVTVSGTCNRSIPPCSRGALGAGTQWPPTVVAARPPSSPPGNGGSPMSIIAWIVLGAIAGYLAGLLVRGDEGLGVIGHIVLGIVGALVGGFLAGALFGTNPVDGPLDISSIVTAVIGAVIVVLVAGMVMGSTRTGRGTV